MRPRERLEQISRARHAADCFDHSGWGVHVLTPTDFVAYLEEIYDAGMLVPPEERCSCCARNRRALGHDLCVVCYFGSTGLRYQPGPP